MNVSSVCLMCFINYFILRLSKKKKKKKKKKKCVDICSNKNVYAELHEIIIICLHTSLTFRTNMDELIHYTTQKYTFNAKRDRCLRRT